MQRREEHILPVDWQSPRKVCGTQVAGAVLTGERPGDSAQEALIIGFCCAMHSSPHRAESLRRQHIGRLQLCCCR